MINKKVLVEEFLSAIKSQYPNISYNLIYNDIEDSYMIWHNFKDYKNEQFALAKINLLDKIFFENDIYDVGFSYSSELPELVSKSSLNMTLSDLGNNVYYSDLHTDNLIINTGKKKASYSVIETNNHSLIPFAA